MGENCPKGTKPVSLFVHFRPIVPSSVCGMADQIINARFLEQKSRTSGIQPHYFHSLYIGGLHGLAEFFHRRSFWLDHRVAH